MTPPNPLRPVPLAGKSLRSIEPAEDGTGARGQNGAHPQVEPREAAATPSEGGPSPDRRRELASLLWGEPEDDSLFADLLDRPLPAEAAPEAPEASPARPAPPVPESAPPATPSPSETRGTASARPAADPAMPPEEGSRGHHTRHFKRRACSFPGLLRVLIPEQSFQPKVFAVRLVDLSPTGARLETKQFTEEFCLGISGEKRFARLEAMVPSRDRVQLGGRIVWAEFGEDLSTVGFQFQEPFDDIDEIFLPDAAEETTGEALALPSPQLDPFPNMTAQLEFHFSGSVYDADLVIARMGPSELRVPVRHGRFEVTLPLKPDRSNFIAFTAMRGEIASIPTPICIVHKRGATETHSLASRALVEDWQLDADTDTLSIQLRGNAAQFHRVLKKLEGALGQVDALEMTVNLRGNARSAADALKELRTKSF